MSQTRIFAKIFTKMLQFYPPPHKIPFSDTFLGSLFNGEIWVCLGVVWSTFGSCLEPPSEVFACRVRSGRQVAGNWLHLANTYALECIGRRFCPLGGKRLQKAFASLTSFGKLYIRFRIHYMV